jgi:hypothetical protein
MGKQKKSMGNLTRFYNYENGRNGNLGPLHFYNTHLLNRRVTLSSPAPPIPPAPPNQIFDLTIFVVLDNDKNFQNIQNNIKNIIVNENKKINYNIYTTTNYNNGSVKNDKNTKNKILILDSPTNVNMDNFINYQYYIYDNNKINNFTLLKNFINLGIYNIK